tara:strand:- start:2154 stop:2273 length:120 start_codon:yes stop_codon:yes gene_type:complete
MAEKLKEITYGQEKAKTKKAKVLRTVLKGTGKKTGGKDG